MKMNSGWGLKYSLSDGIFRQIKNIFQKNFSIFAKIWSMLTRVLTDIPSEFRRFSDRPVGFRRRFRRNKCPSEHPPPQFTFPVFPSPYLSAFLTVSFSAGIFRRKKQNFQYCHIKNFYSLAGYYRVREGFFKDNILPDQIVEGSYKVSKKIKWQLIPPDRSSLMREITIPMTQD